MTVWTLRPRLKKEAKNAVIKLGGGLESALPAAQMTLKLVCLAGPDSVSTGT